MIPTQSSATVIRFPVVDNQKKQKGRKEGLNVNREGSVRKIHGDVYVDFIYLNERVRENAGLPWNDKNAKHVREQLDRIMMAVKSGTFRYVNVFPESRKADYFTGKESSVLQISKTPDQVLFKDYVWDWYALFKGSGRVTGRTLWGYKTYINAYLLPFFGEMPFAKFNKSTFDKFIIWSKSQKFRKKSINNESVNKLFTLLKMIVKDATIEYGWGSTFNPFFGFKKLPTQDEYEKISPFSLEEQVKIMSHLPDHWKPYFDFAFKIGLRQGEQIGLKPEDIDWENNLVHIRRAITRDEDGKLMEGTTKNKHSRRTIKLTSVMMDALKGQKKIHEQFQCEYFFCTTQGKTISPANLRKRIWIPTLEKAGIPYRDMKQTRHSFATNALGCMENPLWIAKVMGHRDTNMIIKVYSKYIMDGTGSVDGHKLDNLYSGITGKQG
jgi:integrase